MASFVEINGDIFKSEFIGNPNTAILHCVSSDYALGAGIAKEIEARFKVRNTLKDLNRHFYPDCILVNGIMNMVTKDKYWNKPTYDSFDTALEIACGLCHKCGIDTLIMPRIGSGLDKLDWEICREMIKSRLVNNSINCIVYYI